jgi:hypothetical protein
MQFDVYPVVGTELFAHLVFPRTPCHIRRTYF